LLFFLQISKLSFELLFAYAGIEIRDEDFLSELEFTNQAVLKVREYAYYRLDIVDGDMNGY
jgi:hypothetical protein